MSLDTYRLLGRSGLRVSPLSLGAMTFGNDWGWGSDTDEARAVFDTYVDRGGNFVDTANQYTDGTSEKLVGEFAEGRRDSLVIATKYSMTTRPGDPNAGGNHRKSMVASVERSLRSLRSDYIDLLYLHAWDFLTPVEEILRAMDDLVSAGKVLYVGISDTPAWQISRMQTTADLRGWSPLVALQIEYSLVERTVERDLIPMAAEMGLGVIPWGPLASGVLTGKYTSADLGHDGGGSPSGTRKDIAASNGSLTARSLAIADVVKDVAGQVGASPAQVAVAWTLRNSAVTSPIVGARTVNQLKDNLGALDVRLEDSHVAQLAEASAVDRGFPHEFLTKPMVRNVIFGDAVVTPRR